MVVQIFAGEKDNTYWTIAIKNTTTADEVCKIIQDKLGSLDRYKLTLGKVGKCKHQCNDVHDQMRLTIPPNSKNKESTTPHLLGHLESIP